jgi:metal-responsive CopG/Arc/MetJ family transcriptional regulator
MSSTAAQEVQSMAKTKANDMHAILSFRLPKKLVARVDKHADRETRSRINMVIVLLQEALDKRDKTRKGEAA